MAERVFNAMGEPATFATAGEAAWKGVLLGAIAPAAAGGAEAGVRLGFEVAAADRRGQGFDLDNLCQPVFSALGQRGWFGGKRNRIQWWTATRRVGPAPGCAITLCEGPLTGLPRHAPLACGMFPGPIPGSGPIPGLADWAAAIAPPPSARPVELHVRFEGREHIGEVACGPIKSVIDGLYPWFGGTARRPDDHRFEALYVERGDGPPRSSGVRVTLWATENAPGQPGAGKEA